MPDKKNLPHSQRANDNLITAFSAVILSLFATWILIQTVVAPFLFSHPRSISYTVLIMAQDGVNIAPMSTVFSIATFLVLSLTFFFSLQYLNQKGSVHIWLIRPILGGFLLWVLTQSYLLTAITLQPGQILLYIFLFFAIQAFFLRHILPWTLIEGLIVLVVSKFLVPQTIDAVQYIPSQLRLDTILRGSLLTLFCGWFLWNHLKEINKEVRKIHPNVIVLICVVITTLMLLPEINHCELIAHDIFFTTLPAYNAVHGNIPLFTGISQYGVLYLAPWVLALLAFPAIPWSYATAVLITTVLLIVIFAVLAYALSRAIENPALALGAYLAAFYITNLGRYYEFPDHFATVCNPAWGALRFDIFIIPFLFLVLFVRKGTKKYLLGFTVSSAMLSLYSFDIGVGTAAVGLITALFATRTTTDIWKNVIRVGVFFFGTVIFIFLLYLGVGYLITRVSPTLSDYWLFTLLYSSGFYQVALGTNNRFLLPFAFAILSLLMGFFLTHIEHKPKGLIFVYLALIQFIFMPYYMGRPINETFYPAILPFILIIGVLIEEWWDNKERWGKQSVIALFAGLGGILMVSSFSLFIPAFVMEWKDPFLAMQRIATYSSRTLFHWNEKDTPAYQFLSSTLPASCSLIIMDTNQEELLATTGRPSAIKYSFIRLSIFNKEQIDAEMKTLLTRPKPVCIFRNTEHFAIQDFQVVKVYEYFWEKLSPHLTKIASDSTGLYELYTFK